MTHVINVPKSFPLDTPENQAQAMLNYYTHHFTNDDGEIRCVECDCRSTHKASHYPCGEEPPRVLRTIGDDGKIVSEVEA
jgi:hypothetical protein